MKELIAKLTEAFGPSGAEKNIRDIISGEVAKLCGLGSARRLSRALARAGHGSASAVRGRPAS